MDLLKRENWWVWLLLFLFTNNVSIYILGAFVKVYDKNAWYAKWQNWLLGFVLFLIPGFIMLMVFSIQILVETAKKLDVPGKETYGSTAIWILAFLVPIIGWIGLAILSLYLNIQILIQLHNGKGEQYI
jgi:heme/copper-type cytochrome/quinol oxidase subunit 2